MFLRIVGGAAGLLSAASAAQPTIAAASSMAGTRHGVATAAQLFDLAEDYLRRGLLRDADRALAVLANDPDTDIRNEARFRRAKLLRARGKRSEAALLLRQVLDEKPRAIPVRLQLAALLQELGETTAALRELRAAQASGLPPAVARLVDRYSQALRATRPSGGSIEIAIAPDSNINNATRSDTLGTIVGNFDIGQDSKAKSGTGLAVRGQLYRRFSLGQSDRKLLVRLSGQGDVYGKARYNDVALDVAGGPELRIGGNQLNFEIGVTQRWHGQQFSMRSARLGATWVRSIGRLTQLRLSGAAALVDNQLNNLQDGTTYSGRMEVERALGPTIGIGAHASFDRAALNNNGYSSRSWRMGLLGWRDFGQVTLTGEAEFGHLGADQRLSLFPKRRLDSYSRFSLAATFRQFEYYGFAPLIRVAIERNSSTIEFYDYRRTRTDLGIVRAF